MSKLILFKVLTDAQLAAIHGIGAEAGAEVKASIADAPSHIVAALQGSAIGDRIRDAIKTIDDHDLKWYEKLEHVVFNDAVPELLSLASSGGVAAAESDVADLGYRLVTSIFTDVKKPADTVTDAIKTAIDLGGEVVAQAVASKPSDAPAADVTKAPEASAG